MATDTESNLPQEQNTSTSAEVSDERASKRNRINAIIQSIRERKEANGTNNERYTSDNVTIETSGKKGGEKEEIKVERLVDDYDAKNGNGVVSTTVITNSNEFDRKERVRVEDISTQSTLENLSSRNGQITKEQEFTHHREYDKAGNLRHSTYGTYEREEYGSGVIEESFGYEGSRSQSDTRSHEAYFDKKGRMTEKTTHAEIEGSFSMMNDEYTRARRGHDINDATPEDMSGIREETSVRSSSESGTRARTVTYNNDGEIRHSTSGHTNGETETYTSYRNGIFREKDVKVSVDNRGNVEGKQIITRGNGDTKKKELSKSKAEKLLEKMRKALGKSLERFGAEGMQDYANQVPETDTTPRAPLGLVFDRKVDREAVNEISKEKTVANQQRLNEERTITATDILIEKLKGKVLE